MIDSDDSQRARSSPTAAGYDAIAEAYAEHLFHELDNKPFDRQFLDHLASSLPVGGLMLDVGCGPGHVARYFASRGHRVLGIDLSEKMTQVATRLNPGLHFEQGDMRRLAFPDQSVAAVVAFYSIIHLEANELALVFAEFHRVLVSGGLVAVAFHVRSEVRRVEELFGVKARIDFTFFEVQQVQSALTESGFIILDARQRPPYDPAIEAQTERCYVLAQTPAHRGVIAESHDSP